MNGSFSYEKFQQDLADLEKYGGKDQFLIKEIDCSTQVFDQVLLSHPCNFVCILPKLIRADRTILQTNNATRVYLEFNESGVQLPFSLIANSLDFTNLSTTIRHIKFSVPAAGAGTMYLLIGLGVSVGSAGAVGGSGGGGYAPPPGGGGQL